MTVAQAAAPNATLVSVLVVFIAAALLILPSIAWLYFLDQRGVLSGDAEHEAEATT
jgi:cytochrome bd-type quinol oxidase subunit 2